MSYSDDPVRDAARRLDSQYETAHDRNMAQIRYAEEFSRDLLTRPMKSATCTGETRNDYHHAAGALSITTRPATVGEVVFDAMDHVRGPEHDEVFALLARAAKGEDIAADSREFIGRLAAVYAWHRAES